MNSKSHREWTVLGVHLTVQTVALIVAVLALGTLVGLAVLKWLESTA